MKKSKSKLKLGINVDHVATLREARGGAEPSVKEAVLEAIKGGADGITVHLREDRRHIQDHDLRMLKKACKVPLNLEMALEDEIVRIALRLKPEKVCIVPEKRQELTTEGGLDVFRKKTKLKRVIPKLQKKGIEVSLFIDPDPRQIWASVDVGAEVVELHTGTYANASGKKKLRELRRLREGTRLASALGLQVNAGHGLDLKNVKPVANIANMCELNIGHSIICRSVFVGMKQAVREMKKTLKI